MSEATVAQDRAGGHYREPSRLATRVAGRCRVRPGTVEQWLHGHTPLAERFYVLLDECLAPGGDHARAADLLAPVYEILANRFPSTCTEEIEIAELRAGQAEDEKALLFLQQRTAERAAARIAAIDAAVFQLLRKRIALRSEFGLSA